MEYGYQTYIQGSKLFMAAASRRMLNNNGCFSFAEGHVSFRGEDGESFWMTPWQYQDESLPEHFVHLSFDFERLGGGDLPVGPASQFHAAIYRGRPDVNCVIHTHTHAVQVISTTGRVVDTFVGEANFIANDQAFFNVAQGFHKEGSNPLVDALGDKSILILANHGSITTGASIPDATIRMIMLEKSARVQVDSELLGGKPIEPNTEYLSDYWSEVAPSIWNSNMRRLPRTDPDLTEIPSEVGKEYPELRATFPRRAEAFVQRGWTPDVFNPDYPGSKRPA